MNNMNCYAFACGYDQDVPLDPGKLGGHRYKSTQAEHMIAAAYVDGLDYEKKTIPTLQENQYLVALFTSSTMKNAYHWLRRVEDGSGNWEHKSGVGSVRTEDARDMPLNDRSNPVHSADLNYQAAFAENPKKQVLLFTAQKQGWAVPYDIFVGYFRCPKEFPTVRKPMQVGAPSCPIL